MVAPLYISAYSNEQVYLRVLVCVGVTSNANEQVYLRVLVFVGVISKANHFRVLK